MLCHNVEMSITLLGDFQSKITLQITIREHSPKGEFTRNYTMAIRKREITMSRFAPVVLALLLSGCSVLQGTPQPPPPAKSQPQEISRNQTEGLQRLGTISVMVKGSPMDVEEEIKAKAAAAHADYYVILLNDDTIFTGQWYSQAILYRQ